MQGKPDSAQQMLLVTIMVLLCSPALAVPLAPRIVGQLARLALRIDALVAAQTLAPARPSTIILINVLQALARHTPEVPNPRSG